MSRWARVSIPMSGHPSVGAMHKEKSDAVKDCELCTTSPYADEAVSVFLAEFHEQYKRVAASVSV